MKRKLVVLTLMAVLIAVPLTAACAKAPSPAGPITLEMITAFPKGTTMVASADYFVKEVNRRAQGELVFDWKGGPEVIPTFDQPEALIRGVFDFNHGVGNYFAGVVPGAYVMELSKHYPADTGPGTEAYDYRVEMWEEHGLRYLGEYPGKPDSGNFYLYTGFRPNSISDLAGKKYRVSPLTRHFIEALGGEPITMPGGDIYLALERGVVDGFIWPFFTAFTEMGWHEVIKYVIDIPVYRGLYGAFMNLDSWNQLPKDMQELLIDVHLDTQSYWIGFIAAEEAKQERVTKKAGVEFITFSAAENAQFQKLSQDALWAHFKGELSPDRYTKLRQLLGY